MKVSDYIVEYLIEKGITDVFGYPGGMITHLMESFSKYHRKISARQRTNQVWRMLHLVQVQQI